MSAWLAPDLYEAPARVNWLGALHMGTVLGTPYKVVLFLLGLVIAGLSVTGVVIWWRKLQSRQALRAGKCLVTRRQGSSRAHLRPSASSRASCSRVR